MLHLLLSHLLFVCVSWQANTASHEIAGDWLVVDSHGIDELDGAVFSFRSNRIRIKGTDSEIEHFQYKLIRTSHADERSVKNTHRFDLITQPDMRTLGLVRFANHDLVRISLGESVESDRPKTLNYKASDGHIVLELRRLQRSTFREEAIVSPPSRDELVRTRGGRL